MGPPDWLRAPRHWLALFAVVTVVPAAVLVWLGGRLIDQDRRLESPRAEERLNHTADRIAAGLAHEFRATLDQMPGWLAAPPPGIATEAAIVRIGAQGVTAHAGVALVFVPPLPSELTVPSSIWKDGDALEDRGDLEGAVRAFRALSVSHEPEIRAGALVRLAADLRKLGRVDDALAVYRAMAAPSGARLMGEPSDLVARAAACDTLARAGRREALREAALAVSEDLVAGRWAIDRATFEFRASQLAQWIPPRDWSGAEALADAVATFWNDQTRPPASLEPAGFRSVWVGEHGFLVAWRREGAGWLIFAAPASFITDAWQPVVGAETAEVSVEDENGRELVGGPTMTNVRAASRQLSSMGLPWTLRVAEVVSPADQAAIDARRRLMVAGLGLLVFLILAGGAVVARAIQKELALARLQTDFVSAVSHEFRTPLTAMAHLTDRLQRDPTIAPDRRRAYYDALARDTLRLRRFVETLLDLGRMEAGARTRLEPADFGSVVAGIVDEFRGEAAAGHHAIALSPNGALPPVPLDRDSFGHALWNLLDNAAKYSPPDAPIEVELRRDGDRAVVRVRDHGTGVPAAERRRIFEKFVRGADQQTSGVRGTGVGLALVSQIARAHGGEVRLESAGESGSVFSLRIPVSR